MSIENFSTTFCADANVYRAAPVGGATKFVTENTLFNFTLSFDIYVASTRKSCTTMTERFDMKTFDFFRVPRRIRTKIIGRNFDQSDSKFRSVRIGTQSEYFEPFYWGSKDQSFSFAKFQSERQKFKMTILLRETNIFEQNFLLTI